MLMLMLMLMLMMRMMRQPLSGRTLASQLKVTARTEGRAWRERRRPLANQRVGCLGTSSAFLLLCRTILYNSRAHHGLFAVRRYGT